MAGEGRREFYDLRDVRFSVTKSVTVADLGEANLPRPRPQSALAVIPP